MVSLDLLLPILYNRYTLKDSSGQLSLLRDAAWGEAPTAGSSLGVRLQRADCEVTGRSRSSYDREHPRVEDRSAVGTQEAGFVSAFGRG